MDKGLRLIATDLELDHPQPLDVYLGCLHERQEVMIGSSAAQVLSHSMEDGLKSSVVPCCTIDVCCIVCSGKSFTTAAAGVTMDVMYVARMARPDLLGSIAYLARNGYID